MKHAYVFPGQGAQAVGMGKDLYDNVPEAKELFEKANDILGFRITDIMFAGTDDELKQTKVTQPAVFLHSVIMAKALGVKPDAAAGHSLGEFSALVVAGALSFEDGLKLVSKRAMAMQAACEAQPGTMAAILGLEDHEMCIRDSYIDGDTYYKIKYPDHNLVRTHAQYRLLQSMEEHYGEMCRIVDGIAAKYRNA